MHHQEKIFGGPYQIFSKANAHSHTVRISDGACKCIHMGRFECMGSPTAMT